MDGSDRGGFQKLRFWHRRAPEWGIWGVGLQNGQRGRRATHRTGCSGIGQIPEWAVLAASGLQNGRFGRIACRQNHPFWNSKPPKPDVLGAHRSSELSILEAARRQNHRFWRLTAQNHVSELAWPTATHFRARSLPGLSILKPTRLQNRPFCSPPASKTVRSGSKILRSGSCPTQEPRVLEADRPKLPFWRLPVPESSVLEPAPENRPS